MGASFSYQSNNIPNAPQILAGQPLVITESYGWNPTNSLDFGIIATISNGDNLGVRPVFTFPVRVGVSSTVTCTPYNNGVLPQNGQAATNSLTCAIPVTSIAPGTVTARFLWGGVDTAFSQSYAFSVQDYSTVTLDQVTTTQTITVPAVTVTPDPVIVTTILSTVTATPTATITGVTSTVYTGCTTSTTGTTSLSTTTTQSTSTTTQSTTSTTRSTTRTTQSNTAATPSTTTSKPSTTTSKPSTTITTATASVTTDKNHNESLSDSFSTTSHSGKDYASTTPKPSSSVQTTAERDGWHSWASEDDLEAVKTVYVTTTRYHVTCPCSASRPTITADHHHKRQNGLIARAPPDYTFNAANPNTIFVTPSTLTVTTSTVLPDVTLDVVTSTVTVTAVTISGTVTVTLDQRSVTTISGCPPSTTTIVP